MYDNIKSKEVIQNSRGYDYNQNIPVNDAPITGQPKHLQEAEKIANSIIADYDETSVNEMIFHIRKIVLSERELAIRQLDERIIYLKNTYDQLK